MKCKVSLLEHQEEDGNDVISKKHPLKKQAIMELPDNMRTAFSSGSAFPFNHPQTKTLSHLKFQCTSIYNNL